MSRKQPDNSFFLDLLFKPPRKLTFSKLYRFYFDFILRLLYRIFIFESVPETVQETFMKLVLFTQGKICFLEGQKIMEGDKELLALNYSRADTTDVYYIPRKALVTNPRLKQSYTLTPGEDCEIVYLSEADKYNLSEMNGGLYSLIERTATMLADNDISLNISQKNTRLTNIVSGDTQNTVDSIRAVICSMYEGDPTIVVKSSLIDKLQGIPILNTSSNNQNLVQLIEVNQYILAHFYEQIGIVTHDQMKRERLVTAEINDNIDLAFLNIDDIIESLQEGLDRVNAMFGTSISVKLNPIIERQKQEQEAAIEMQDQEDGSGEAEEEPAEEEPAEEEPAEEEPAEEEPAEEEPAEEEPAEEEPEQNIEIVIEGDNNNIIIGGDDVGSSDTNEVPNVGSDSSE